MAMERALVLNRAPTHAEVHAAMVIWENLPDCCREVLRPCVLLLVEQQYTREYALVTVVTNADYFARIGADRSWAVGCRYTDDI